MSSKIPMMKWAIKVNEDLNQSFPATSEAEKQIALTMALAMRVRSVALANDDDHSALCEKLAEALVSFPEGGSYQAVAEQLAEHT